MMQVKISVKGRSFQKGLKTGCNLPYRTSSIVYSFASTSRSSMCQSYCAMPIPQVLHDLVIQPDSRDNDFPCCKPPDIAQEKQQHMQPELDGLNTQSHQHKSWASLDNQHQPVDVTIKTSCDGIDDIL